MIVVDNRELNSIVPEETRKNRIKEMRKRITKELWKKGIFSNRKGHTSHRKGLTYFQEYGKEKSEKVRKKIGRSCRRTCTLRKLKTGYSFSPEFNKRMSEIKFKFHADHPNIFVGTNNPNWRNGVSFELYGVEFNEKLINIIKERDNHTCQYCGSKENICVHHIDYNKKNNSVENLLSLCMKCNSIMNFNREVWTKYWKEFI